jgi:hypothetical protein
VCEILQTEAIANTLVQRSGEETSVSTLEDGVCVGTTGNTDFFTLSVCDYSQVDERAFIQMHSILVSTATQLVERKKVRVSESVEGLSRYYNRRSLCLRVWLVSYKALLKLRGYFLRGYTFSTCLLNMYVENARVR